MLSKKIGMLFTFLDSALLPQLLNGLYGDGGDEMKGLFLPGFNLIVTQCGYSLDEINDMIQKMRSERT